MDFHKLPDYTVEYIVRDADGEVMYKNTVETLDEAITQLSVIERKIEKDKREQKEVERGESLSDE